METGYCEVTEAGRTTKLGTALRTRLGSKSDHTANTMLWTIGYAKGRLLDGCRRAL